MSAKIVLITGASSGIGYSCAELLAQKGYIIYALQRRTCAKLSNLGVQNIKLDITKNAQIHAAIEQILAKEGRIDILINNAGYGAYGAIEDTSLSVAKAQFEVNLFGLASITRAVIPIMRQQKTGTIINISSVGGRLTTYFGAWYHASKYALEAFSDALRMEVANWGIKVVIIEPGGIKTPWGLIAADNLVATAKGGVYEQEANKVATKIRKLYSSKLLSSPKVVAKTILRAINSPKPKARYVVGFGARPLLFLHKILPARSFDYFIKKLS